MDKDTFKQRVYNKLFITADDATNYGYAEKIAPLLDECLTLIANSDLALRKTFKFRAINSKVIFVDVLPEACKETYICTKDKKFIYQVQGETGYHVVKRTGDTEETYSYEWETLANHPMEFALGNQVLSVRYADEHPRGATFYVVTDFDNNVTIKVDAPGCYSFVCDCLYPEMGEDFANFDENENINVPVSILNIAVIYVAAELMYDIDVQRAAMMKNDFELALARLDEERQDVQEHFSINSRW